MRATIFGIATLALAGLGATSASALPVSAGITPAGGIQQVRIVERKDAPGVGVAVAELLAGERPEPLPWWDPAPFTEALGAALPASPKAP